jgi:membrane protease YdiL (CAAX protease family)
MGIMNPPIPGEIESKILQIYIPAILLQSILITLVYISLRKNNEGLSSIGFGKADFNFGNAVSGVIFFIGASLLMFIIKNAFLRSGYLPPEEIDYILPITLIEKILWFILSLGAALSEEFGFRGFIISRTKILTNKYLAGAIIGSLAFSMGHIYQGISGVILTFIYGMLFAGLYIARRSLFPCVVAHFLQDIIVLFAV